MKKQLLFLHLLLCVSFFDLKANNLQIGVPTVNVGASTISFTIQWDNSWLVATGPTNWDAIWVFVKRQACADNVWNHALVNTGAVHSVTGGVLQADAVTDGMGAFIRRTAAGIGNIASCTVTLQLQTAPNLVDNFKVFGIEMVNVPQGDFYIGDGTRGTSLWGFSDVSPTVLPKLITNAIQTAGIGAAGNYQVQNYGSTGALTSAFPLGWNRFYCMKYEISQEQYVSFLNTLTYDQQVVPTQIAPNSAIGTLAIAGVIPSRNSIKIKTSGTLNNVPAVYGCDLNGNGTYDEAADGLNIACNWINWASLMSYLDWTALRPMTEFEFEKVCRGTSAASASENAWGNSTVLQAESGALTNSGLSSEVSTASGTGLCAYGINTTAKGPLRCGFAATGTTLRIQAGATFYGAMDMSGNVAEQCVGGYNFNYSAFTSANGDGTLSASGAGNTVGWPTAGGAQAGGIVRGVDWFTVGLLYLNVSDRAYMTSNINQARQNYIGGRGVRSY